MTAGHRLLQQRRAGQHLVQGATGELVHLLVECLQEGKQVHATVTEHRRNVISRHGFD